jgi:hypothetical protein
MRASVRSSVTTSVAIAAAGVVATAAAALPAEPSTPRVQSEVRLAAPNLLLASAAPTTAAAPAPVPLGAPIEQFLLNQLQDCSLICPLSFRASCRFPFLYAILPLTLAGELQQGVPFVRGALLSDATVSGALNDAVTHIIDNDLNLVLPRAQNALEVAVVGLIDLATNAVTQPDNIVQALNDFRATALEGLMQPPGTMPPATAHNELEAAVIKAIDITSALTFQAPERLLLGLTQAGDAFFRTIGNTGDIGATFQAVGSSVSTTLTDSLAFINHAFNEQVPVSPMASISRVPKPLAAVTSTTVKINALEKAPATASSGLDAPKVQSKSGQAIP